MTTQNQTIRKILIAPDKFKGSLTSFQAASAIKRGIEAAYLLPDNSCAGRDSHPGNVSGGICSAEGDSSQLGNNSGAVCAPGGDASQLGNNSGGICSAEGNSSQVGNNSGAVCALSGDASQLGNNSGVVCAAGGEDSASPLQFRIVEIADGGDGSLEVLQKKIPGASIANITVHDPLGREVASRIMLYRMPRAEKHTKTRAGGEKNEFCAENCAKTCPDGGENGFCAENAGVSRAEGDELCAFIEMAKVSGLEMLAKGERNPLHTSTYGMGEAIKAAIAHGATQITLSIGGSATNDGGAGMLQALGYRFFDAAGVEIAVPICGGDLQRVATVVAPGKADPLAVSGAADERAGDIQGEKVPQECVLHGTELQGVEFKVICDVTNPLLGEIGATAVYGPQKGADAQALVQLEAGLANYAAVAEKCLGVAPGMKVYPGAGAAGGVGYAGLAFLGAELVPGWKFFARITSLEESVQWADLVITGEGSLDSQSLSGKVVSGVINLAAQYNKEVVIFCGVSKLSPEEMKGVAKLLPKGVHCYSIASLGHPLEVCMRDAAILLKQLAFENVQ